MAFPLVLPALGAVLAGAATLPAIKKALENYDSETLLENYDPETLKEWFNTHITGVSNVNTLDNIQKTLVLKALENQLLNDQEFVVFSGSDNTIPVSPEQGQGATSEATETTVPGGPNEPYRNDDDDENWLDRYKRKRNEYRREKAKIEDQRARSAERELEAEKQRAKISRERISADKAYQEYLLSRGRSIPRPSKSARPITQALPRFFGWKGLSTTNRFYHSPAMGTLEWAVPIGVGIGGGMAIGKKIYNNVKENDKKSDVDFSNNLDKSSEEISIEYTW